jgi:hypothetical protein
MRNRRKRRGGRERHESNASKRLKGRESEMDTAKSHKSRRNTISFGVSTRAARFLMRPLSRPSPFHSTLLPMSVRPSANKQMNSTSCIIKRRVWVAIAVCRCQRRLGEEDASGPRRKSTRGKCSPLCKSRTLYFRLSRAPGPCGSRKDAAERRCWAYGL